MLSCFPPLRIQVLTSAQWGVFSHPLTPAERFKSKENVSKQRSVENIFFLKKGLRGKRRGGDVPVTRRVIEWRLARETEVPSRDGESEKIELRQLETGWGGGVCEWKGRKKN